MSICDKQKPLYRPIFINKIPNIEEKSYLEVGVGQGLTFHKINAKIKKSVDVRDVGATTYLMTSDEYFDKYDEKFDIIFIDGDHNYEQVLKDFNNAIDHLEEGGIILVHDVIPCDEERMINSCKDGYKLLATAFLQKQDILFCVEDDEGLSLFRRPRRIPHKMMELSYNDFIFGFFNSLPVMTFEEAEKKLSECWE